MKTKGWISLPMAAKRARVTWATMYNWILKGSVRAERIGARWFVDPSSIPVTELVSVP